MFDFTHDPKEPELLPMKQWALLASPTMHGTEPDYIQKAYESGWMTTAGENIDDIERLAASYTGAAHAVALSCGTAALHLAVKLAAKKLYQSSTGVRTPDGKGTGASLCGRRVFCSDLTFAATVNPVVYEGGEPVFIDSEYETWNMDPEALERAFELYPQVRLVILAHLYGTPAKVERIRQICDSHQALLIEDAAESLGASVRGRQTGSFGDYAVLSFNGNKIITGSGGGMLLVNEEESARLARKWSTQSREDAPWYEHRELGYNYRISNVIAGVIRGQWEYIGEHIRRKKEIYERYRAGFEDLPVRMNPAEDTSMPNYWLSCILTGPQAMTEMVRSADRALYLPQPGRSCPAEILETLNRYHAEGRPVWKPMHLQPLYQGNTFVSVSGGHGKGAGGGIYGSNETGVSTDLFKRGLCLPSDIKMTQEQQDVVIAAVRRCFG